MSVSPSAYSGVLLSDHVDTNRTVIDKHPLGQRAHPDSLIEDDPRPPEIHPVLFKFIDASVIRLAALRTTGAAGPSGLSAANWKRQCTSFKSASNDLCDSLAITTQYLCMKFVDPLPLFWIALNKNPGVHPIGIGDTARRIIAKAILDIQKPELNVGQISGIEAVVHAVNSLFPQEETETILLVDASNAFNSLNCCSALHNIRPLCPSLATALINSYRAPTELFVDGDVLYFSEVTTQGLLLCPCTHLL